MMSNIRHLLFLCILGSIISGCTGRVAIHPEIHDKAIEKLHEAANSDEFWVQVHAFEFLCQLGHTEWVESNFEPWKTEHENTPKERIGVWRVGVQLAASDEERKDFLDKIKTAYQDTAGLDRIHAAESLAKLGIPLLLVDAEQVEADLEDQSVLREFVTWGAVLPRAPGDLPDYDYFFSAFEAADMNGKEILAYALVKMRQKFPEAVSLRIHDLIRNTPLSPVAKSRLKIAVILWDNDPVRKHQMWQENRGFIKSEVKSIRYEFSEAMALYGEVSMIGDIQEVLLGQDLLSNDDSDLRETWNLDCQSAAAFALLSIENRNISHFSWLDWLVIALFLVWMIGIGYYYALRSRSKEDYLLGGRSMNPFMVGLSLFATLLSTLSYLAYPGEMIKYGPMVFFGILAFPVAHWIVGRYLIPRFMEMNVTSAYEILEIKLGGRTRNLGTIFFLLLRFLWMSTIIYATVNTALIHIIGFPESWVPIICVSIALVTVFYTALGGIRAVVMTDAIQSFILLAAALMTILIISWKFDPALAWFPDQWLTHWEDLNWGVDFNQRMTIGNIFIMTLVWQVCTAGSDQMAIQRYLSTKSADDARKTYKISLLSSGIVQIVLAIVGLAVASYFLKFPGQLEAGTNVYEHADSLFPRFVLIGLPSGITGLVVAGIMAAAMSSLSSGLNSSSSVISEDVLDRHFPRLLGSMDPLKKVRWISIVLGVVVSFCSMFVGYIEGNLLDVIIKVVNLVVAPLFVLFFMALFVPGSTDRGTFFGGLFSLLVAILIAFFGLFNLSVLTIMPVSLVAGILGSWVFSKLG